MIKLEIYADVVFLINFVMDMFVFYMASRFLNCKLNRLRWIFGSFSAAIMYCLIMFTGFNTYMNFYGACAVLFISVMIIFVPKDLTSLLIYSFAVIVTSLIVGGAALGLFCYTDAAKIFIDGAYAYDDGFPVKLLIFACCIATAGIACAVCIIKRKKISGNCCTLSIIFNKNSVSLKGLVDTGNLLVEPISRKSVIIADYNCLKRLLPQRLVNIYESGSIKPDEIFLELAGESFADKIRLIPFKSVGNKSGIMIGFVADMAIVDKIKITKPVIGISDVVFSKNGKYGAVLNPVLIGHF